MQWSGSNIRCGFHTGFLSFNQIGSNFQTSFTAWSDMNRVICIVSNIIIQWCIASHGVSHCLSRNKHKELRQWNIVWLHCKGKQAYTHLVSNCSYLWCFTDCKRSSWKYILIILMGISSSSPSKQVEKANLTLVYVYWHDLHTMQIVLTNSFNIIINQFPFSWSLSIVWIWGTDPWIFVCAH